MGTTMWAMIAALSVVAAGHSANAAEVRKAHYGTTKDGRSINAYTLINDRGASATILDFGGVISEIRVPDRNGGLGNVVMSFNDMASREAMGPVNAIVGRFANRLRNGFTLDGVHYPLAQNARGVTLHGGVPTYATRVWTVDRIRKGDGAALTLRLNSPDADQGFPGNLKVKVTYHFTNANALRLDFVATTDRPTVLNLTNHIYFNLNGNSTTPVYTHDLQVMADKVAVKDADSVPTGELQAVAGTPFDLTAPTVLGDRVAASDPAVAALGQDAPTPTGKVRNFDHSFVLRAGINRLDQVAARLHDPVSGRTMELRTTEPSIQVFTPNDLRESLLSDVGKPFVHGPAVALETQHLPDSPNHPQFPSTILRRGETFRSTTIFAFSSDRGRSR